MRRTPIAWIVGLAAVVGACGGDRRSSLDDVPSPRPPGEHAKPGAADDGDGIDLRVSNGAAGAPAFDRGKLAPTTNLDDAATAALLARAPAVAETTADRQAFALRPASLPPPKTGTTVAASFPPPAGTLAPPAPTIKTPGALSVLRVVPDGPVPIAPSLSITFDQPMVAVTSQEDAAQSVPVKLTPQPKGRWRWLGTRTLMFDPDVRFPQATTYTVEIPAGTRAISGTATAAATTTTFETPPPGVEEVWPSGDEPQRTDTPIFVRFDQKIDPQAVLAKLKVTAAGGWDADKPIAIKLLDAKTIAATPHYRALGEVIEAARVAEQDGRWLAFAPVAPLPVASQVTIEVAAGTPSAEGPNVSKDKRTFTFRTYPKFEVQRVFCNQNDVCRPGNAIVVELTNPVDLEKLDPTQLPITPPIANLRAHLAGTTLYLSGTTIARTKYSITLPATLVDAFGQTLGTATTRTIEVGDAEPTFYGPSGMVVLDPAAKKPTLDFFATNYTELKVRLYKVTPGDFTAYQSWQSSRWSYDDAKPRPNPPGVFVGATQVKTGGAPNALAEVHVDLSTALSAAGLGHVIAVVEPSPFVPSYPNERPPELAAWVQATKLGLEVHHDRDRAYVIATELATGAPAGGVAIADNAASGAAVGTTDATGVASYAGRPSVVMATRGDDRAFVITGGEDYMLNRERQQLTWYVIDDRKLYKPGETVSLKGLVRLHDFRLHGDLGLPGPLITAVDYLARDSQGNEVAKGTWKVSAAGTFDGTFALPKTPNLGFARVELHATGADPGAGFARSSLFYRHVVRVEEFRRPEFEVKAHASQGPFVVGDSGDVTVDATYFAGGALAGAPVRWDASASRTSFTPPGRDDYAFGEWTPWWGDGGYDDDLPPPEDDDGPRFGRYGYGRYGGGGGPKARKSRWSLEAKTDAVGAHTMHLDFLSVKPAVPMSVVTTASVTDLNRQQWAASTSLIVHPATAYVGLHAKRPFVEQGTPFDLDVIGVDLDGALAANAKITVETARLDQVYVKGAYQTKRVEPQTCAITMAASAPRGRAVGEDGAQACHFTTAKGGRYDVIATITDAKGRANTSKLSYWVSGGETIPAREVTQERAQVIPDKKSYAPGNTAELLVMSPFYPAEGVVTWRRGGIVKLARVTLTGPTTVVAVPIEDAMTPNLEVRVDLVGAAARLDDKGVVDPALPKRPAYAVGVIDLPIPPVKRTLAVAVTPAAPKLAPGETTSVAVAVTDADGKPVANAETTVIVVDESILSLAAYTHPDPVASFYHHYSGDTVDHHSRGMVTLARPDRATLAPGGADKDGAPPPPPPPPPSATALVFDEVGGTGTAMALDEGKMGRKDSDRAEGQYKMAKQEEAPQLARARAIDAARNAGVLGASIGGKAAKPEPIALRSNFDPLAAFAPAAITDANGKVTVEVKLPDNLTRYRVVAIATAGEHAFGKGESAVTVRLPMMVRPSAPRFLNFGDTFQLPVVIQNQTDAPMSVKLAVRATNAKLTAGGGRVVSVPPNDRAVVELPAAAELAGTARFQFVAEGGGRTDAAEVALPVWTPATTEAFATYGVIDDGAIAQPVALPGQVVTQFGGLEVTTASTNLQALTDALLYIVHYPFECSEQRSSRILAIAALRDVLAAFGGSGLPAPAALAQSNAVDLAKIAQLQNADGGFVYWERGWPSVPFLSVYVTHALALAKAKGYDVPEQTLARAQQYLATIEERFPDDYPIEVKRAIRAYALATRALLHDVDVPKAKALIAEAGGVDKLGLETLAWLLQAIATQPSAEAERAAIVKLAQNRVSETAGAANFRYGYSDGGYLLLASDRRVDALMLDAFIREVPKSDLIPKLVTGLLAHQKAGRWLSTQENTWVLLALDRYFQTYEKATPSFTARVWLGKDYAGEHAFRGHTTEQLAIAIAMADVATHDKSDLVIQKDGVGRLYYRVGMTYAPASLALDAADYGFVVTRTYTAIDDPGDVVHGPDGVWHVKAGARVRVKLAMVNENRRYHVALVDPMPAGFEALNPALASTPPVPPESGKRAGTEQHGRYGSWGWWSSTWYEHQNLRDERAEAFTQLLWEGVHDYTYVARATTRGTYVVPPTKAEEMYMPETFGRSHSDRVVVE